LGKSRVLVVGLDGATFDVVKPLAMKGKLPNIRMLLERGVHATLKSTINPSTSTAWTTFATGKNPGKHGIYGFVSERNGSLLPVRAGDRTEKSIWQIANQHGLKTIVVNVPWTFPPDKVDGIMISGMDTPDTSTEFVHPPKLRNELIEKFDYAIDVEIPPLSLDSFLRDVENLTKKRAATAEHLMKSYEWDLFISVFVCLDRVQHFFWKYYDGTHPQHSDKDTKKYREVIPRFYKMADEIVGRFMDLAKDSTILLMSDHGFGPLHKLVHLERWMAQQGFTAWKETTLFDSRHGFNRALVAKHMLEERGAKIEAPQLGQRRRAIIFHLNKSDTWAGLRIELATLKLSSFYQIGFTARSSSEGMLVEIRNVSKQAELKIDSYRLSTECRTYLATLSSTDPMPTLTLTATSHRDNPTGTVEIKRIFLTELDWTRTIAYSLPNSSEININQKGREFFGQIQPGKKSEELKDIVTKQLRNLKVDGKPLVEKVYRRERLYWGEQLDRVPDLIFTHNDYRYVVGAEFHDGEQLVSCSKLTSGTHRFEGILMMYGEGVRKGVKLPECDIQDVAPTALYILGVPIPRDMDGKVLINVFDEAHARPISYPQEESPTGRITQPTDNDKRILERLKALGYLA